MGGLSAFKPKKMNNSKLIFLVFILISVLSTLKSQTLDTLIFYPTPVSDTLFIEFTTTQMDTGTLNILSLTGANDVTIFKDSILNAGTHNLKVFVKNWPTNLYIGKLRFNYGDSMVFIIIKSGSITGSQIINQTKTSLLYPSPSNGILYVKGGKLNEISVFNTLGKLIYQQLNISTNIDLTFLPNGIYFIYYEDKNNKYNYQKIIIRH